MGFIIYRLAAGDEDNSDEWVEIGTVPATVNSYVDDGLPSLINGAYRYAVRSVYTNNVVSDAGFSNIINYEESIPYIGNLQAEQVGNNVHLSWEWASGMRILRNQNRRTSDQTYSREETREFLGFKITRNGPVIAEGIMQMNYVDEDLESGSYTYTVIGEFTNGSTNMIYVQINVSVGTDDDLLIEPLVTALLGNHPNPFNPDTTINYSLANDDRVTLEIYNIRGQLIRRLVDDYQNAGRYNVVWDGKDEKGRDSGSGIFFYRMKSGVYSSTRKMIMMK